MSFFHDKQRNLVIYEGVSDVIAQAIPESKILQNRWTALPFNLRNAQVLAHFNAPVPPIITDDNYDFPIEPGKTPLAHQKTYANFSVLNPKMFNLGDPGTMKTLSTLWALDWLMSQYPKGTFRALVIAPLSILETVWATGVFRNFLGRRSVEILHGSEQKRLSLLDKKADISVINFDGVGVGAHTRKKFELDGFAQTLADRKDIQLIVIDEASAYSDATTKRHRIARAVFGDRPYIWQLTGTPTSNAPTDAYGMAKLVNNAFGKSFRSFQMETMTKVTQFKWVPQKDGYEKARRVLTPSIRFAIEEIWDGPEMTTQQRQVELTADQKKLLVDLKKNLQVAMKGGTVINAINEGAARTKFLQIVLGAVYDEHHRVHTVDNKPRMDEVERIIESTDRKVLIFVPLTSVVHLLDKKLSKRWKCGFINGEVAPSKRPDIIRAFETDPDFKVMIVDPQATAHGINEFVVADTVIWMGPTEKTELYIQGNKRAHRPGQKWPVTIYQIVATAFEKEIFRRLETNQSMQGVLLNMVRNGEI